MTTFIERSLINSRFLVEVFPRNFFKTPENKFKVLLVMVKSLGFYKSGKSAKKSDFTPTTPHNKCRDFIP